MENAENAARVHTHTHTHTHTGTLNKRIKSNKGSITSFTLLSMMFFLIVVVAIYASVNTKIQKQQKELNSIQKSYEQENLDDIYQKKYNEYLEKETSTIQVYADTILKGEVIGKNKNTIGTVYTDVVQNKIKIFGGANSTYGYSETVDGKKTELSENEITIQATTSGKTIYTWIKGEDGEYTKYYTAVTVKLSTLQDKTIYVAEGKSIDIGEISGENKGKIKYSKIDTNYVTVENNKVTGKKAGDTTIIATESNGGAQAKITIKIVKLTLEKTKEITTVGDNKKIQVSGINNGTISAKSNDETIAKVTVNGTEVTVIPQNVGNAKIMITENNAGANIEYEIQVVGITLAPNGGTYTMPTTGKATIRTKVKVENASKIEVAWTSAKLEWKTIENNSETIKNDCEKGTYYLYVKIDNEYLYQSQAFIVGEEKIAIAIKTSTTTWTNQNITVTIAYPDVTTSSTRKAGYGTTLANAQTAATSATAPTTSVTVTANGYVYATATDTAGNVITASKQITNIDKVVPTVTLSPNGGSYAKPTSGNATIKTTITAADTGGSGLKTLQYAWSTSNTTEPTTWTTFTNGATVSKTDCVAGTYYLWTKVYDNAGNRATTIKVSGGFIVGIQTITINQSTTTWTNQNITVTITYPSVTTSSTRKAGYGTTLANAQTAATSATAPTTSVTLTANGYVYATATDTAGNVITASRQITNIDKTAPEISEFSAKASTTISTSATITVKAKDGLSGLSNLVLEWGTNTNYGNKKSESCLINGKGATDLTTKTISLTDLSANTTYYVKITISDVSGNVKTSTSSFTTGKAIAETNNVLYTSIQNALDSIEKQGTVKVLSDTTENVNIDTEKTITVNLNSKTITGFLRNWGTTTVYGGNITEKSETLGLGHAIENYGGKLTITSGTYTGYYQGVYQPSAEEGAKTGEIIIEGGNYYGTGKDGTGIALKQGNCLIKKGYFKGTVGGAAGWDYSPTITVQNGEFYGEQYGIFINSGTLDIKDGYFEGTDYAAGATENSKSLSISGGKFYAKTVAGVYTSGCDNLYITNGYFKGSESSGIASFYTKYVNISNGEFVGYNNGIYMHDGTTATISGGKFSGYLSGLAISNSTITITEGTFTGDTVDALSLYKSTGEIKGGVFTGKLHGGNNNNGSFTITGGKFRGNVEDGFYNENGTLYINGGNFSGYKWGINSPSGKIWYRRTDSQTSDNNYVSSEGWPAVTASDLSFY